MELCCCPHPTGASYSNRCWLKSQAQDGSGSDFPACPLLTFTHECPSLSTTDTHHANARSHLLHSTHGDTEQGLLSRGSHPSACRPGETPTWALTGSSWDPAEVLLKQLPCSFWVNDTPPKQQENAKSKHKCWGGSGLTKVSGKPGSSEQAALCGRKPSASSILWPTARTPVELQHQLFITFCTCQLVTCNN